MDFNSLKLRFSTFRKILFYFFCTYSRAQLKTKLKISFRLNFVTFFSLWWLLLSNGRTMKTTAFFFKIDTLRLLTKYLLTQALIMACYEIIRSHKYYEGVLGVTHRFLSMFTLQKRALWTVATLQRRKSQSIDLSLPIFWGRLSEFDLIEIVVCTHMKLETRKIPNLIPQDSSSWASTLSSKLSICRYKVQNCSKYRN